MTLSESVPTKSAFFCWQKNSSKRTAEQIDQIPPISTGTDGTFMIVNFFPMIQAKDRQDVLVFQATGQKRRNFTILHKFFFLTFFHSNSILAPRIQQLTKTYFVSVYLFGKHKIR